MAEQAKVAKRKTHTKSRKGCFQCKQRHTKCNEARPRCANCVRLDIPCTWPTLTNGYTNNTSHQSPDSSTNHVSPSLDTTTSGSPDVVPPRAIFDLSLPDMRLLHHWTSKGYKALHPRLAQRSDAWGVGLVELGFEFPWLLHGFLALSAVHKASFLVPSERSSLLLQADAHISQALEAMRRNLESPDYETSIPMFVLSSVLLTYNFGSVQEMPDDPIRSMHHCFMLLNGIKVVIGPHWDQIKDYPPIAPMIEMSSPDMLQHLTEASEHETFPEILRLMEITDLVLSSEDKQACNSAIQELHWTAICSRHIPPSYDHEPFLFLWAARASNRFLDLLAAHNPVACIITVHFAALMASGKPNWWVVKWPRFLLKAAEGLLVGTPDLLSWLDWPQRVINNTPWEPAVQTPGGIT